MRGMKSENVYMLNTGIKSKVWEVAELILYDDFFLMWNFVASEETREEDSEVEKSSIKIWISFSSLAGRLTHLQ